jgi:hypothetical protein
MLKFSVSNLSNPLTKSKFFLTKVFGLLYSGLNQEEKILVLGISTLTLGPNPAGAY